MGTGTSGLGKTGGRGAGSMQNDQALTRQFLDGIATSATATQIALESARDGSSFSLLGDVGRRIDYKKFDDGADARWQRTEHTTDGQVRFQNMVDVDRVAMDAFENRADVFSMNFRGASAIPKSQVSVRTSQYVGAHGKSPAGRGNWAFDIGGRQVFFSGKYADAKKKAIAQAASEGIRQIMTLS